MRCRRAAAALVLAMAVPLTVVAPAGAATSVDQARSRANAAAAELARAQTALARAQGRVTDVSARLAATRAQLGTVQGELRDVAVARYLRGTRGDRASTLGPTDDAAAVARAQVLADTVLQRDVGALDRYRALVDDLSRDEALLRDRRRESDAAIAAVRRRAAAATAEVDRLAAAEAQRVAAARKAAGQKPAPKGAPVARPTGRFVIQADSWVCPVQGPRAFSDDYGDARNGGTRRHEGNDILAPRGTPVVAPVAGSVRRHDNGLGGIAFYLNGSDGNTYYGAHLDAYAGVSGGIDQGTVIGWVGNTGDARGGPTHLHFEIHPGGGGPVDPYPTLRAHC